MRRGIAIAVSMCVIVCGIAPASADVLSRDVVSETEDATLLVQQSVDAEMLAGVVGGDGSDILAAVGVVLLVLIVIGIAAGP